jgi:hypothetical protein
MHRTSSANLNGWIQKAAFCSTGCDRGKIKRRGLSFPYGKDLNPRQPMRQIAPTAGLREIDSRRSTVHG